MKKILLIVAKNIESGGVEAYYLNVLRHIHRDDLKIEILVPKEIVSQETEKKFLELGCSFIVLHIRDTGIKADLRLISKVHNLFSSRKYDIVHVNTTNLKVESICLAIAHKNKVTIRIAHSHGTLMPGSFFKETVRFFLRKAILRYANELLACSTVAAEALVGKKDSFRVKIAKNGIDVAQYRFNEDIRGSIRKKFNWTGRFIIGIIARISPEKNHLFMLDVMKCIVAENNRILLVFIGTGDSKYMEEVREKVNKLGLQNNVHFLGERHNVNELIQGLDLHVLPSIREALGIVNIEAQAAGLHCICSSSVPKDADITGLVEFIPLEQGEDFWAERILRYDNGYKRRDMTEIVKEYGYDISTSVETIDQIYHGCSHICEV